MATIEDLKDDLEALIATPLTATGLTYTSPNENMTPDHRVPPDEITLQIVTSLFRQDLSDSNKSYLAAEAVVTLNYNMEYDFAKQTTWLETHLHNILLVVLPKSAWRDLASVHEVIGGPEAGTPEKEGDIISVSVTAVVLLN
jgi:hypothetical protein